MELHEKLPKAIYCLKKKVRDEGPRKDKILLGITSRIFVHQEAYKMKDMLKRFYTDKSHPLCSPMVVRSLDVNNNPYRPQEKDEELFYHVIPYPSAI